MGRVRQALTLVASAIPALPSSATPPRSPGALTAAASPMTSAPTLSQPDFFTPEALRVRTEKWQEQMLEYVELVPEVGGTSELISSAAGRIKLRVTGPEIGDTGKFSPIPAEKQVQARELQKRLDAFNLGRATQLIFLVGEYHLYWPEAGMPEVLSIEEVNVRERPWQMRQLDGNMRTIPAGDQLMRVWRESPRLRGRAYSPFKSAMELIKSMYMHQLSDTSLASSRLAGGGILIWPTTLERQGLDENGQPFPRSQEELLGNLHRAMQEGLAAPQRDSRAAWAPFVNFVDPGQTGEDVQMPELLRLDPEDQTGAYAERYKSYEHRLAVAIDLPIESVEGMGETNHWSGYAIREDKLTEYVAPLSNLTVSELRDRVAKPLGLDIESDYTALIQRPDSTEVLMQMASMRIITPESLKLALISGKVEDLVMIEPSEDDYTSNTRPTQPSDFKPGGDRGGGKYIGRTNSA